MPIVKRAVLTIEESRKERKRPRQRLDGEVRDGHRGVEGRDVRNA